MITKRIIPCLDVKDGRVVKGVNFLGLADVSSPVKLAKFYSDNGADELVFYDITASYEGRALFCDILTEVARTIYIPLTVGGGIHSLDDFDRVLKCGADKVSVNTGAIRNPALLTEAAKKIRQPMRGALLRREAGGRHLPAVCKRRQGGHGVGRHPVDSGRGTPGRRGSRGQQHRHRRGEGRI